MSAKRSKIFIAILFSLLIVLILPIGFVGRDSRAQTSNVFEKKALASGFDSAGEINLRTASNEILSDFNDFYYIPNANYFYTNPLHESNTTADSKKGLCTTVAVQMLLGYHNYYSDRRLIPKYSDDGTQFLDDNYGLITDNPLINNTLDTSGGDLGKATTGTRDEVFQEIFDNTFLSYFPIGQMIFFVRDAAEDFVEEHAAAIKDNVTIQCGINGVNTAKNELDAQRPVAIGYDDALTGATDYHVMVAYGYAYYGDEFGFIVHYGQGGDQTKVWVPADWVKYYISMNVEHEHTFTDANYTFDRKYRELECSTCGCNTVDSLFETDEELGTTITGLKYAVNGEIEIPKEINGNEILTVAASAFENIDEITEITFDYSSAVITIGDGAFANCADLLSIELPKSLQNFGNGVFTGCESLREIDISPYNQNFSTEIGCLYDKDKTILYVVPADCYSYSTPMEEYVLPSSVISISECAIQDNLNLHTINLSNLQTVPADFLKGCYFVSSVTGNEIEFVGERAFSETDWFKNKYYNNIPVTLGNAYICHAGTAETVDLNGFVSVTPQAFYSNSYVKKVIIGPEMQFIGDNCFTGCTALNCIDMLDSQTIITGGDNMFFGLNDFSILVGHYENAEYKTASGWSAYANKIVTPVTIFSFDTLGGEEIADIEVEFGAYPELPSPDRPGFGFIGWRDEISDGQASGNIISSSNMWRERIDEITLYADWEATIFYVSLSANGGTGVPDYIEYTTDVGAILPIPEKTGYNFMGWYESSDFSGEPLNEISIGTYGTKSLYARWEGVTVTVGLKCCDDSAHEIEYVNLIYGQLNNISYYFPEGHDGYILSGWKLNDIVYFDGEGNGLQIWNLLDENIILTAEWIEAYYIKIVVDEEQIYWVKADGTKTSYKNQSGFEYGQSFPSMSVIEQQFNPFNDSLKTGHCFQYFTFEYFAPGTLPNKEVENNPDRISTLSWEDLSAYDNRVMTIYPYFLPENYYVFVYDFNAISITNIMINYGEDIATELNEVIDNCNLIPYGYEFDCWQIMPGDGGDDASINDVFEAGTEFSYLAMPDLSVGKERVGTYISLRCIYTPILSTINFESDNNLTYPPVNIEYGTMNITLPVPEKAHYTFLGWYDGLGSNAVKYGNDEGDLMFAWDKIENTTLYAKWQAITYTITYDPQGGSLYGSSSLYTQYYTYEDIVTLPEPTRTYYRFDGWYLNAQGTGTRYYSLPVNSSGHFTFYAKWQQLYVVMLFADSYTNSYELAIGESITLPTFSKDYHNGVWSDGSNTYNFGSTFTCTGTNVTLNVQWTVFSSYNLGTHTRTATYTITDGGQFTNSYDYFGIIDYAQASAFNRVKLIIQFTAWEKDDGYQHLYVYNGNSESAKELYHTQFEHGSGHKDQNPADYEFVVEVNIADVYGDGKGICIRYNASGNFSDTWYNNSLTCEIILYP